ncbi:MAG: energy transducer TonB [Acidobacteria bacterium]|nr:energy transducer TonB [Acidobacteriota bacterium]
MKLRHLLLLLPFNFCLLPFAFSLCLLPFAYCHSSAQIPFRLAILDLQGDEGGRIASLLRASASEDKTVSFELIDQDLIRVAARGAGYDGSLNLSRHEARALGNSIGCDYYILGKVQVARRLGPGEHYYFEALAGLFIVETRTGRLIKFVFEQAKKASEQEAQMQLEELIKGGWGKDAGAIISERQKQMGEIENTLHRPSPIIEVFNEESEGKGIQQPVFYQRLKPAYTEQAELAGITATVELEVEFGEDGRVGEVEVVRWAGFGLDESAIATVRVLRFKPAGRDGKGLTIRGLVRYNFRRPHSQAAKPQALSQEEIDRLKESLRGILRPGQRPR